MPLLPAFTVHDFIKKEKSQDNIQEKNEAKEKGLDADEVKKSKTVYAVGLTTGEVLAEYPERDSLQQVIRAITGEDNWTMIPVTNSSNILNYGWKENKCRVQFKNLHMFEFEPVPEDLWNKFQAAKSKGQFFSEYIKKNKYIKPKRIL